MGRTPANTIKERYLDSLFSNHEWTRMDTNFCKPQNTLNTLKMPRRRQPIAAEGGAYGLWPMAYGLMH